jgi:hypothetical protein
MTHRETCPAVMFTPPGPCGCGVSALVHRAEAAEQRVALLEALLVEARGHLKEQTVRMLAFTPERLVVAIDRALKARKL